MKAVLAAALAASCTRSLAPASCEDALGGVYEAPGGRWFVLDSRPAVPSLEAYPLFPDAREPATAPRVIDLHPAAAAGELTGTVTRRYHDACDAHAPVHVTACSAAGLDVVLADPLPPLELPAATDPDAPCRFGPAAPSRRERWTRE